MAREGEGVGAVTEPRNPLEIIRRMAENEAKYRRRQAFLDDVQERHHTLQLLVRAAWTAAGMVWLVVRFKEMSPGHMAVFFLVVMVGQWALPKLILRRWMARRMAEYAQVEKENLET